VHGVGGTPPDAVLGDLAPEQVSGDAIAGFFRTSDHSPDPEGPDAGRHVEVYSWGGLTSRSKVRVLWLALLPFLFANLAGWMCSVRTRRSGWRFRLHHLTAGLGALALTVNAALILVLLSADVLAYQTARAGLVVHQWWLAPLSWHGIAAHPARQVLVGFLVPALFVLALVGLASRSWRYESVRPPYRITARHNAKSRQRTAATLPGGLADEAFWDGEGSVRLLTWLHVAVIGGFLAIALSVTAKTLTRSPHDTGLAWVAVGLGAVTIILAVCHVVLDALSTPAGLSDTSSDRSPGLSDRLRSGLPLLLVPAIGAVIIAGVFAWLQPGGPARQAAELPGMTSVTGWTVLAIAVAVAGVLLSTLLGLSGGQGTLTGGPWVTLMLGFTILNTVMLGAVIWVAHLVGPVTSNAVAALARPRGEIYIPDVVTSGVPLVVWAAVLAGLAFVLVEIIRMRLTRQMRDGLPEYEARAREVMNDQQAQLKPWYRSGCEPFTTDGEDAGPARADGLSWQRKIARAQFLGHAPHDSTWLLWALIIAQLVMAVCVWQFHVRPPVAIRNIGIAISGFVLPGLAAFLYRAWGDPTRRRTLGILWDVGTFWPRSYHPLSPPCYTERAIPELQRRMWWLHDNGGHVVLAAHSQGSMLATAALLQRGCRPEGDWPALITFGSPVCNLYSWGFPAYVTPDLLTPLAPGQPARVATWLNFYYPTDPIGGPIALNGPEARAAVNQHLLDPAECLYVYGQQPPAATKHSGYWADPRVWSLINQVAAEAGQHHPADGEAEATAAAAAAAAALEAAAAAASTAEADQRSPAETGTA